MVRQEEQQAGADFLPLDAAPADRPEKICDGIDSFATYEWKFPALANSVVQKFNLVYLATPSPRALA